MRPRAIAGTSAGALLAAALAWGTSTGCHSSTASAQTPSTAASGGVMLLDAAGTVIGPVLSCGGTSCVVRETIGGSTMLTQRSVAFPWASALVQASTVQLWFDGPGCTGAAVTTTETLIAGVAVPIPGTNASVIGVPRAEQATLTAISSSQPAPCSAVTAVPVTGRRVDVVNAPVAVLPYQLRFD